MKQVTLILGLFLLFGSSVKSQTYVPFPKENAKWTVYFATSHDDGSSSRAVLRYAVHGDTLINDTLYTKFCLETGDLDHPKIETVGVIREENKKIYYDGAGF